MSSLVWGFSHLSWFLRSDEISDQVQTIAKALHLWCVAYTEGTCVYLCRSCLKHTWPISRLDVPTWFIVTRCVSLCVSRHQSSTDSDHSRQKAWSLASCVPLKADHLLLFSWFSSSSPTSIDLVNFTWTFIIIMNDFLFLCFGICYHNM